MLPRDELWTFPFNLKFIPRQVSKSVIGIKTMRTTLSCPYFISILKYVIKCDIVSLLSYFSCFLYSRRNINDNFNNVQGEIRFHAQFLENAEVGKQVRW